MRLDKADAAPALVVSLEIAFMLLFVLMGVGAASNLFAGYKDSPDSTYLTLGGLFFALAAIPGAFAFFGLRAKGAGFRLTTGVLGIAVFGGLFIFLTSWDRPPPRPAAAPATEPQHAPPPALATPSLVQPVPGR